MARSITTGIDIGTNQVKVVVTEMLNNNDKTAPRVIGTGLVESKGLRHGYIINSDDVTKSVVAAVHQAEKTSGVRIRRAFLSVGGISLSSTTNIGTVVISRADTEISELDLQKVAEACEKEIAPSVLLNRKIIHAVPLQYKLDGKPVLGKALGMKGGRLECKMLFITSLEQHLNDMIEAVEEAGIEVADVMAAPLAASLVVLTKTQKIAGCVLANIGAETVSVAVFENSIPISLEVFPVGSTDITNDIALGLKIPLEEAESIKLGGITTTSYPRKKLEEIISARLSDMFELIEAHLKKIGKSGLLPAGIIITGGGSGVGNIADLARTSLKLPSRLANFPENHNNKIQDAFWSVAYGLCLFGFTADDDSGINLGFKKIGRLTSNVGNWFKQFLP